MERLSASLALCEESRWLGFPHKGVILRKFDVSLKLNWKSCWTNSVVADELRHHGDVFVLAWRIFAHIQYMLILSKPYHGRLKNSLLFTALCIYNMLQHYEYFRFVLMHWWICLLYNQLLFTKLNCDKYNKKIIYSLPHRRKKSLFDERYHLLSFMCYGPILIELASSTLCWN